MIVTIIISHRCANADEFDGQVLGVLLGLKAPHLFVISIIAFVTHE